MMQPLLLKGILLGLVTRESYGCTATPRKDSSILCGICGDAATGNHYGALSCDGCKGFFRRSIRSRLSYACSKVQGCDITKQQRNHCRYCRLRRCFNNGMKADAVQSGRDKIAPYRNRRLKYSFLSVGALKQADEQTRFIHGYGFGTIPFDLSTKRMADVDLFGKAITLYSMYLMGWANRIPCFEKLSAKDKVALHAARTIETFLFELAFRSMQANGYILLFDKCAIHVLERDNGSDSKTRELCNFASMLWRELVTHLLDLQINEAEFATLKAIVYFDPTVKSLSEDVVKVRGWRDQICSNLLEYISSREANKEQWSPRMASFLLLLKPLANLSWRLVELIESSVERGYVVKDPILAGHLKCAVDSGAPYPNSGLGYIKVESKEDSTNVSAPDQQNKEDGQRALPNPEIDTLAQNDESAPKDPKNPDTGGHDGADDGRKDCSGNFNTPCTSNVKLGEKGLSNSDKNAQSDANNTSKDCSGKFDTPCTSNVELGEKRLSNSDKNAQSDANNTSKDCSGKFDTPHPVNDKMCANELSNFDRNAQSKSDSKDRPKNVRTPPHLQNTATSPKEKRRKFPKKSQNTAEGNKGGEPGDCSRNFSVPHSQNHKREAGSSKLQTAQWKCQGDYVEHDVKWVVECVTGRQPQFFRYTPTVRFVSEVHRENFAPYLQNGSSNTLHSSNGLQAPPNSPVDLRRSLSHVPQAFNAQFQFTQQLSAYPQHAQHIHTTSLGTDVVIDQGAPNAQSSLLQLRTSVSVNGQVVASFSQNGQLDSRPSVIQRSHQVAPHPHNASRCQGESRRDAARYPKSGPSCEAPLPATERVGALTQIPWSDFNAPSTSQGQMKSDTHSEESKKSSPAAGQTAPSEPSGPQPPNSEEKIRADPQDGPLDPPPKLNTENP